MIRFENVLKRSLQDVLKTSWRRLQNVLNKSWRCLEDVLKTSWRRLEDVLKTFLQDVLKTSWRRLENVLKTSWRRMTKTIMLVLIKVFWRRLLKTSSGDVWVRGIYSSWSRRLLKTKNVFKTSSRRLHQVCWVSSLLFLPWWRPSKVLEIKNKDKSPRNALKKIAESKFHTKMISFNLW